MAQPKEIHKLIDGLLRNFGIETKVKEHMALVFWPDVVGEVINNISKPLNIMDGILFVKVESSTWRAELTLHKESIIKKLNKKVGKPVIAEIRFIS